MNNRPPEDCSKRGQHGPARCGTGTGVYRSLGFTRSERTSPAASLGLFFCAIGPQNTAPVRISAPDLQLVVFRLNIATLPPTLPRTGLIGSDQQRFAIVHGGCERNELLLATEYSRTVLLAGCQPKDSLEILRVCRATQWDFVRHGVKA